MGCYRLKEVQAIEILLLYTRTLVISKELRMVHLSTCLLLSQPLVPRSKPSLNYPTIHVHLITLLVRQSPSPMGTIRGLGNCHSSLGFRAMGSPKAGDSLLVR